MQLPANHAQQKSVLAAREALFIVHLFRKTQNSVQPPKLVTIVGNISLSYMKKQCSLFHLVAMQLGQVSFFLSPLRSCGDNSSSYLVGLL